MSKYHLTHTRHIFRQCDPGRDNCHFKRKVFASSLNNTLNLGGILLMVATRLYICRCHLGVRMHCNIPQVKETILDFKCNGHCESFGEQIATENIIWHKFTEWFKLKMLVKHKHNWFLTLTFLFDHCGISLGSGE